VRVRVLVRLLAEQQAALAQVGHQRRVGVLEEQPADERDPGPEVPVRLDRVDHRQPVRAGGGEVLGAERGGLVHQPGAVLGGHVVGQDHVVRAGDLDQLERPAVARALQRGAREPVEHLDPVLAEHRGQQRLGHHEGALRAARDDVLDPRVDRDRGVGHQRPRRRRPDQEVRAVPRGRAGGHREPHVHRGVDDGLVALGDLVVGQAGPAARAVRA
jgi:hypothetical protein